MNPLHTINKNTKINCYNMRSSRTGDEVPNQIVVEMLTEDGRRSVFKSYQTIIAMIDERGCVTIDKNYRQSTTTEKYLNQYLGNTKPERRKLIKQGVYTLADLN